MLLLVCPQQEHVAHPFLDGCCHFLEASAWLIEDEAGKAAISCLILNCLILISGTHNPQIKKRRHGHLILP